MQNNYSKLLLRTIGLFCLLFMLTRVRLRNTPSRSSHAFGLKFERHSMISILRLASRCKVVWGSWVLGGTWKWEFWKDLSLVSSCCSTSSKSETSSSSSSITTWYFSSFRLYRSFLGQGYSSIVMSKRLFGSTVICMKEKIKMEPLFCCNSATWSWLHSLAYGSRPQQIWCMTLGFLKLSPTPNHQKLRGRLIYVICRNALQLWFHGKTVLILIEGTWTNSKYGP